MGVPCRWHASSSTAPGTIPHKQYAFFDSVTNSPMHRSRSSSDKVTQDLVESPIESTLTQTASASKAGPALAIPIGQQWAVADVAALAGTLVL